MYPIQFFTVQADFSYFKGGTLNFSQFSRLCTKLQHQILSQSVNISIVFYHKDWDINEKVESLEYLMIGKNGEHSKMLDMILAELIHLETEFTSSEFWSSVP